jgi:hypothetical protein
MPTDFVDGATAPTFGFINAVPAVARPAPINARRAILVLADD